MEWGPRAEHSKESTTLNFPQGGLRLPGSPAFVLGRLQLEGPWLVSRAASRMKGQLSCQVSVTPPNWPPAALGPKATPGARFLGDGLSGSIQLTGRWRLLRWLLMTKGGSPTIVGACEGDLDNLPSSCILATALKQPDGAAKPGRPLPELGSPCPGHSPGLCLQTLRCNYLMPPWL